MLTPEEYDEFESRATRSLPNRIIEAYRPEAFSIVGYPTRVDSLLGLHRYVDVMHETGFLGILELFLKGLTEEEFGLLKKISLLTSSLSERDCGKRVVPRSALLWSMIALRHVRALFPDPNVTILEIGPGSGYLGALLGLLGYNYVATDVCQAMYLWQNALWKEQFGERLIELATSADVLSDHRKLEGGRLVHVPWWKFSSPDPESVQLDVDCIVCIDVITELQVFAMRYLGRQSARWLRASPGNKALYVQGTGQQFRFSMTDVIGAFRLMSLDLAYADKMDLPAKYAPHDMFHFFVPNDRPFKMNSGGWLADRGLQAAIAAGRRRAMEGANIGADSVQAFHRKITGRSDNDTDDERFWNFCNGNEWKWY